MTSRWIGSVWTRSACWHALLLAVVLPAWAGAFAWAASPMPAPATPLAGREPLRVFFTGRDVRVEAHAPNGESLTGHLSSGALAGCLAAERWGSVVLQEPTLASTWVLDGAVQSAPPDMPINVRR